MFALDQMGAHNYKLNQKLFRFNVMWIPLGIMFAWVGSYYSRNSQSTVPDDCFLDK